MTDLNGQRSPLVPGTPPLQRRNARGGWLSPAKVLELYSNMLSPYERQEVLRYPHVYYMRKKATLTDGEIAGTRTFSPNNGFDDSEGNYYFVIHDQIAYRYEILGSLGKGEYGQVLKVFDHKRKEFAAMKIIRGKKPYELQAKREVAILKHLLREEETDEVDSGNVVKMKSSFSFRNHVCIAFELLSLNLYDLMKKNRFQSFDYKLVRNFTQSIILALKTLANNRIIHADLKPDNIMLKRSGESRLKIIDLGLACYEGTQLRTYVQSRYYRAPEVIIGCRYGIQIDMWSLGCIVAEMVTGGPLLPGKDEDDQLALIVELLGIPGTDLLSRANRRDKFFTRSGYPRYCRVTQADGVEMVEGSVRGPPGSRSLKNVLKRSTELDLVALDFVQKCLDLNPDNRMTPSQALTHPFVRDTDYSQCFEMKTLQVD